jgi:hypothetical protein
VVGFTSSFHLHTSSLLSWHVREITGIPPRTVGASRPHRGQFHTFEGLGILPMRSIDPHDMHGGSPGIASARSTALQSQAAGVARATLAVSGHPVLACGLDGD